jgi:phage/plasmid primase-like uncharacterized protein
MADLSNILGGPWSPPAPKHIDTPEGQLRTAMLERGITPPDNIDIDGKLHRFRSGTKGEAGHDKSGWYVIYGDGIPSGQFGDWRTGETVNFRADIGRPLSTTELMINATRQAEAKALRDADQKRAREVAENTVELIWTKAAGASQEHPYLKRKGIGVNGARITGDGRLVVPLYGQDGTLSSLQYIDHEGGKLYHSGGATGGKFWMLGTMDDPGTLYIGEGFATCATIHEASNRPCAVAYSASNIVVVTGILREIYGATQDIVIVADNDASGVGQRYAEQASAKYGARMVMPPMLGDANDYAQAGHDLGGLIMPPLPITSSNVVPIKEFMDEGVGISYVWQHILARGWLYAMTANPGSGKTSVCLYMSVMMALGKELMGKKTMPCKVLFLCGENPQDVRLRMEVMLLEMDLDINALNGQIYLTRRPFAIDDKVQLARFSAEAVSHGPYDLMVIDTGPAHSSAEDENDNRAMHELAIAMRNLMEPLGKPCTIALMHPHKSPTKETLLPRGGSAFVGSIDGCLCLWRESGETITELFPHGQKFRGRPFNSMYFDLQPVDHPTALDNFGDPIGTVIAVPGDKQEDDSTANLSKPLAAAVKMFEDAVTACGYIRTKDGLAFISAEKWSDYTQEHGEYSTDTARRSALSRAKKQLIENGMIKEVKGGFHATEAAMSGVFAGCFMGLESFG